MGKDGSNSKNNINNNNNFKNLEKSVRAPAPAAADKIESGLERETPRTACYSAPFDAMSDVQGQLLIPAGPCTLFLTMQPEDCMYYFLLPSSGGPQSLVDVLSLVLQFIKNLWRS